MTREQVALFDRFRASPPLATDFTPEACAYWRGFVCRGASAPPSSSPLFGAWRAGLAKRRNGWH